LKVFILLSTADKKGEYRKTYLLGPLVDIVSNLDHIHSKIQLPKHNFVILT
jgi:hypothetical protein